MQMVQELCISATVLYFPNLIYKQKYGTAMGYPVLVTMENLVKENVKERAMEHIQMF